MTRRLPVLLALLAAAVVFAAYVKTLGFGFRYDDYHFARPWTTGELLQVLHGSWDPTRIEPEFFRPVAAWWYALRFALFGLNGQAQHAVSLAGMALAATLCGLFVWREVGSARAAAFATALYAIHPALVYSQAVWLTNQMHLMASLLVLTSLLEWQRVRAKPARAWWALVVLQVVGFGIKEDLVMLAPLLVALTFLRHTMQRDTPAPSWSLAAAGVVLPLGFFWLRYKMLGRIGGYGPLPPLAEAWDHATSGLIGVFRQLPAKRPWQPFASMLSQGLLIAGAIGGFFRRREAHLLVTGLVLAIAFDAPFVFVAKPEQYHLVALGAVLALAGAIDVVVSLVPAALPRAVVTLLLALASLSFFSVTRSLIGDFAPCSPITLSTDAIVGEWWVVPPEIQDWLRAKPAQCRMGALVPLGDSISTATWAYGADVDGEGRRSQWTSGHAVILVTARAAAMTIGVWSPVASPEHGVDVTIAGAVTDQTVHLSNVEWRAVPLSLLSGSAWSRGMRRIDIGISPTFVPALLDPASADTRHLGVRLRIDDVARTR